MLMRWRATATEGAVVGHGASQGGGRIGAAAPGPRPHQAIFRHGTARRARRSTRRKEDGTPAEYARTEAVLSEKA